MSVLLRLFLTSAFLLVVSAAVMAAIFDTFIETPESFQKALIAECWVSAALGCSWVITLIWS